MLLAALGGCSSGPGAQQAAGPALFPADKARDVNPDTHLQLTFTSPPEIGTSGLIRIYDAADNSLADTIDMSIPPSPRPTGRAPDMTEADRRAEGAAAAKATYQLNTIDGVDFHFFPIIVRGSTATIYPHNNKLRYGHSYVVKIDAGVLKGMPAREWTFATKAAGPAAAARRVVVAADGSGDFNTVQGALDYLPDAPAQRTTIFIRNGRYEEIVYFSGKSNITIRGEDREKVQVGYPNNSAFNPPKGGPSRRPAFSIQDGRDIQLSTFTINNYFIGQAEALLVRGERIVIDRMTLSGSGDALTTNGSIYMVDSKLVGDGDTILGYAALFCLRCEIQSVGPFTWTRTPQGSHGNVFVDSTFIYLDRPLPWTVTATDPGRKTPGVLARLPRNGSAGASVANFPWAEMVLINSRTQGVPPEGWGPVEEAPGFDSSNVHLWEFNTMDMTGRPIDMTMRHPVAKQLTMAKDAQTIADYSKPEFVLGGWKPVVE
jgi:hypothetical protein